MRRGIYRATVLILVVLIFICGGYAAIQIYQYMTAKKGYENIIEENVKDETHPVNGGISLTEPDRPEREKPAAPYPELSVDHQNLLGINPDYVGVLHFPAFQMTYPVAISHDNQEYLKKTFDGKKLFAGCIFLEMNSKQDLSGWNSWIFGHNMNNGSMFGSLKHLINKPELLNDDPHFYVYMPGKVLKYRVFAYHTTSLGGPLYRYVTASGEYDTFIKDIRKENLCSNMERLDLSGRPRIVTLSTCHGKGHVKSFVVHGMLTGEYKYYD